MNTKLLSSMKYDSESLAACDTGFLREMIAQNSKKIDQQIKELEDLKNRILGDKSAKAIA